MSLLNRYTGHYNLTVPGVPGGKSASLFPPRKEFKMNSNIHFLKDWTDKDYYLIEFFDGKTFDVFSIDEIVPSNILDKIKNDDKTFLYLFNRKEGYLNVCKSFYKHLVIDNNIRPEKIYIGTGAPDLGSIIKAYADENNLGYINVDWVVEFEHTMGLSCLRFNLDGSTILTDKIYQKFYLCFNRRWRSHRVGLVALLKMNKLLHKGYVSLAPSDDGRNWEKMFTSLIHLFRKDDNLSNLLIQNQDKILSIPPLYLDTPDLVTNRADFEGTSLYLYENSIVSVITETYFFEENEMANEIHTARFLSEKIFKPIAVGHPFIYVAPYNSLELLRNLGYQTFHPYIDESYDLEVDSLERLKKVTKEIERISNFNSQEIKEFCRNVKDICNYNQQLMKERLKDNVNNYIKKML